MYPNNYNKPSMRPKYKLAHAYVPYQYLKNVFRPNEALCKGTLFPELYMPYKYKKNNYYK